VEDKGGNMMVNASLAVSNGGRRSRSRRRVVAAALARTKKKTATSSILIPKRYVGRSGFSGGLGRILGC
jgi:hypothetical protein